MDGEYQANRALTEAERLVNVRYLGHCLHDSRKVWRDRSLDWHSRCSDCPAQISIVGSPNESRLSDAVLAEAWSNKHIKTAASTVCGSQLQHVLERDGWIVRHLGVNGRTACELKKGGTVVRSPFMRSKAEATVAAGAMTIKKHLHYPRLSGTVTPND